MDQWLAFWSTGINKLKLRSCLRMARARLDSPWIDGVAQALTAAGLRVIRFEFAYMAARRAGTRKPPPRADLLLPEYRDPVERLAAEAPLIIGGKSMGGRVASMVADEMQVQGRLSGCSA